MYRIGKIIVSVAACPHLDPYLDPHPHHRFRLLIQSVVTIYRQLPGRQEAPRYEPLDHRLAEVKIDRARRNAPAVQPLSPNQLERAGRR